MRHTHRQAQAQCWGILCASFKCAYLGTWWGWLHEQPVRACKRTLPGPNTAESRGNLAPSLQTGSWRGSEVQWGARGGVVASEVGALQRWRQPRAAAAHPPTFGCGAACPHPCSAAPQTGLAADGSGSLFRPGGFGPACNLVIWWGVTHRERHRQGGRCS